jgi:hypothetical protein
VLPPLLVSIQFVRGISRDSTQSIAYRWIRGHVPADAPIVIERYALRLDGPYRAEHVLRLTDRAYGDYTNAGVRYVIASSESFGSVLDAPQTDPNVYARYRELFDRSIELFVVKPSPDHPGPELRVYRLR